jgi:hypothetical protein
MNRVWLVCVLALQLTPLMGSRAQWSSDSSQNSGICVTSGEQALPRIGLTSDGGCYVSWFDNRSGSYRVYLQRLSATGTPQWTENGLLISNDRR